MVYRSGSTLAKLEARLYLDGAGEVQRWHHLTVEQEEQLVFETFWQAAWAKETGRESVRSLEV